MHEVTNRNRMKLLMIAGLPLTVILLATWLWIYVVDGEIDIVQLMGTANRGQLITPPLPLHEQTLYNASGVLVEPFTAGVPTWRILVPSTGACLQQCQQVLYYTRQIHTAMGKYKNRIERLYLAADAAETQGISVDLAQQHPNLQVLYNARPAELNLPVDSVPGGPIPVYYLVDPQGWIMMYYAADADGKDVMADLKFLLKNSNG
jgi:hypothetical protein